MTRKDIAIAREAVSSLVFPHYSLVDGEPAELVQIRPWRASLFRWPGMISLPYDLRSVPEMRRALRIQRLEALLVGPARLIIVSIGAVLLLISWINSTIALLPYFCVLTAFGLQALTHYLDTRLIPPQYPRQRKGGDLIVREVPADVAEALAAMNHQVRIISPED